MRKKLLSLGLVGGALLTAQVAGAHELSCDKTVNGTTYMEVSGYPTTLHYVLTVNNTSPLYGSYVLTASDPLLEGQGFSFTPAAPFSLDFGASTSDSFDVVLNDEADCLAMAAADGTADDRIDNTFETSWESGSAQCTASVVCKSAPPPPPPPPSGITRTLGFYKTHESALSQCLEAIDTDAPDLASVLGVFWGSPAVYETGEPRTDIDRARFLMGRQFIVAACNATLFPPASSDVQQLLADAMNAYAGTDCDLMMSLSSQLDDYNNSGDEMSFPAGFDPGPATPKHAQSIADDPTTMSADQCGG